MQNQTFFALFCILSVGMNAFVAGVPAARQPRTKLAAMKLARSLKNNVIPEIDGLDLETFSKTKEHGRDYLSDLIWQLLTLTVGAFLEFVDSQLLSTADVIESGQTRLEQTLSGVNDDIQEELRYIIENALEEALEIVEDIIDKLGLVIPNLTSIPGNGINMDPNDIIEMILGMSLEEFLTQIMDILERSDTLLVNTITSLDSIAGRVNNPAIAEMLRTTSNEMLRGRDPIRLVLTKLYLVLQH